MCVAQNTYAVTWFIGNELNFVFGIMFGISRLVSRFLKSRANLIDSSRLKKFICLQIKGSTISLISLTPLYEALGKSMSGSKCLGTVLFISTSTCLLPLFCAVGLVFLDRKRSIQEKSEEKTPPISRLTTILNFPPAFWLVLIICASFYCGIFPFISIGKVFYISKYDFHPFLASTINRLTYHKID